jgi:hypothetical protein
MSTEVPATRIHTIANPAAGVQFQRKSTPGLWPDWCWFAGARVSQSEGLVVSSFCTVGASRTMSLPFESILLSLVEGESAHRSGTHRDTAGAL